MIIIICVLTVLLILAGYVIYNLYRKNEYLTRYAENIIESIEIMRNRVLEMNSQIRLIDKRGTFESDDEVGFFFKELKNILMRLNILYAIVNDKPLEIQDDMEPQSDIVGGAN
jgi:hypothetical protein